MTATNEDLKRVIEGNPKLCEWGWWTPKQARLMKVDLAASRARLMSCVDEFKLAVEWLKQCKQTKTASSNSLSSYTLKHRAEQAMGAYISNGALIAAALHLGIPVKPLKDSPNPGIGISKTCPVYQAAAEG